MTLKEVCEVGNGHNIKIAKDLNRFPAQVVYVLREPEEFIQMPCITAKVHYHNYDFDCTVQERRRCNEQ